MLSSILRRLFGTGVAPALLLAAGYHPAFAQSTRAPINDLCSNATVITQAQLPYSGTITLADAGDDSPDVCTSGADVFFSFTPTQTGFYRVSVADAANTAVSIYAGTGCDFATLDFVGCPDGVVNYFLTSGSRIVFAAGERSPGLASSVTLNLSLIPPVHNTCATALTITQAQLPFSQTFDTAGNRNTFNSPCEGTSPDLYFRFQPTISGRYRVRGLVSGSDTITQYFSGDCPTNPATPPLACQFGELTVFLTAGTPYTFISSGSPSAEHQFNVVFDAASSGSGTCETAEVLSPSSFPVSPSVETAGNASGQAFFKYNPAFTGRYIFSVPPTTGDSLSICSGPSLSLPSAFNPRTSNWLFAGTEYRFGVTPNGDTAASFTLDIAPTILCDETVNGAWTESDFDFSIFQESDFYNWNLAEDSNVTVSFSSLFQATVAIYDVRGSEPVNIWERGFEAGEPGPTFTGRLERGAYTILVRRTRNGGDPASVPYTLTVNCVNDLYRLAEANRWSPRPIIDVNEVAFPVAGFRIEPPLRTVNGLTVDLADMRGVVAADFTQTKLVQDNGDGVIDGTDPVLATATVTATAGGAQAVFSATIPTGNDLYVVSDVAGLAGGDEFTAVVDAIKVVLPSNSITGPTLSFRHQAAGSLPESPAGKERWTLGYRAPMGTISRSQFSPDGTRVIVAYNTGSAWIFDSASNTPQVMLRDHDDGVVYAGFDATGATAITVSRNGTVSLWDATTGVRQSQFSSGLLTTQATPSANLRFLAVISESKVILLDIESQRQVWSFVPGQSSGSPAEALSVAFSPDGTVIAVGASDNRVYVVNATTGVSLARVTAATNPVTAVAFTGSSNRFISASTDATVRLLQINSGSPVTITTLKSISLDGQAAVAATVSSDGNRIALVTNSQLRVFDTAPASPLELFAVSYENAGGSFGSVQFSPDRSRIALAGSGDSAVRFHTATNGAVQPLTLGIEGTLASPGAGSNNRPRFTKDGIFLFVPTFSNSDCSLYRVPTATNQPIVRLQFTAPFTVPNFSTNDDGSLAVVSVAGFADGLYTVSPFGFLLNRSLPTSQVKSELSAVGGRFSRGDRLYASFTGALLANNALSDDENRASQIDPVGRYWGFITGQNVVTMSLSDPAGTTQFINQTTPYTPYKMFYTPDGTKVGIADSLTGVQFYDLAQDIPVGLFRFPEGQNTDAELSRDGSLLLIGGGQTVRLYDTATGETPRWFFPATSESPNLSALGFGRRDTRVFTAWSNGALEVYNRVAINRIEVTPPSRVLAEGASQSFRVEAVLQDGSRLDISPESGDTRTDRALWTAGPASGVSIDGSTFTVQPGATGDILLTATIRVAGSILTDTATITVGTSTPTTLTADPAELALTPGVARPIRYRLTWSDGYSEDVTGDVALSTPTPELLDIRGNEVSLRAIAPAAEYTVTGSITRNATTVNATTTITLFGPRSYWERQRATPGGEVNAIEYAPSATRVAVGYSSGNVAIYEAGASPQQYTLESQMVLPSPGSVLDMAWLDEEQIHVVLSTSETGIFNTTSRTYTRSTPPTFTSRVAVTTGGFYVLTESGSRTVTAYNRETDATQWSIQLAEDEYATALFGRSDVVMIGTNQGRAYRLFASTGGTISTTTAIEGDVRAIGPFSGDTFFALGADRTLIQAANSDGAVVRRFEYPFDVTSAANIGNELAVSSANPTGVYLYNSEGLLLRWIDASPGGRIATLAADPSGTFLLTGQADGFNGVQFWERGRGLFRGELEHSWALIEAAVDFADNRILTQSSKRTRTFHWGANPNTSVLLNETGYFLPQRLDGFSMAEGSNLVALSTVSVSTPIQNYLTGVIDRTIQSPDRTSLAVLNPSGDRLATYGGTTQLRFWNLPTNSQINVETRAITGLAGYRTSEPAPRRFFAATTGSFLGLWNESGILATGTPVTNGAAFKVVVNRTGTRALVAIYLRPTTFVSLNLYDISNPAAEPALITTLATTLGAVSVNDVAMALSEDGTLALIGSRSTPEGAKLIDLNGSAILRTFTPAAGIDSSPLVAAQFANGDRAVMLGWQEGYAELIGRLNPTGLDLTITEPGATGPRGRTNSRSVSANPGEFLQGNALVTYENNALVDVTASAELIVSNTALAVVEGTGVRVSPTAQAGQSFTVTATYREFGTTVTSAPVTVTIGEGDPIKELWIVR